MFYNIILVANYNLTSTFITDKCYINFTLFITSPITVTAYLYPIKQFIDFY